MGEASKLEWVEGMVKSYEVGLRLCYDKLCYDKLRLHRKPTNLKNVLNHVLRWFIERDLSCFQVALKSI